MMRDLFEVMLEHCGGADFASEPREHRHLLSTGERGELIGHKTSEEVELSTGITIEVRTASFRSLRGFRSLCGRRVQRANTVSAPHRHRVIRAYRRRAAAGDGIVAGC
jgi:hypothetical protein